MAARRGPKIRDFPVLDSVELRRYLPTLRAAERILRRTEARYRRETFQPTEADLTADTAAGLRELRETIQTERSG